MGEKSIIPPPPHTHNSIDNTEWVIGNRNKHRFSLRNKLLIVFGVLILTVGLILSVLAVRSARKAVTEKVEAHLIDKASSLKSLAEFEALVVEIDDPSIL